MIWMKKKKRCRLRKQGRGNTKLDIFLLANTQKIE